jgi:hypothetical protein
MKTLRFSLIVAVIALGAIVKAHAQDPVPYLTLKQMPNIINCLPAPPDTASEMFHFNDILAFLESDDVQQPLQNALAWVQAIVRQ